MALVFCPCREPRQLDRASVPSLIESDDCFFSLNSLLYCENCRVIRCPFCTRKEPLSWFCSQCLMETTKASARESSNRCMRNCLRCPRCAANAIIRQAGDGITVACSLCEYKFSIGKKPTRTLGSLIHSYQNATFEKIKERVRSRFPSHNALGVDAAPKLESFTHDWTAADVPMLVPLRAKFSKLCTSCGCTLSSPSKRPTQADYLEKHTARAVLPELKVHRVDNAYKLMARNFSSDKTMRVKIESLDNDISLPEELVIPPAAAEDGFPAPLFLVFRESLESRQAFMSGDKNVKSGPGWAVGEMDLAGDPKTVRIYTSTSLENGLPVGAWMKLDIQN